MSRRHLRQQRPGPLELIEEAVDLLRLAPWAVLGAYYLGSLPFVLALLYFWGDMSRGSTAYEHCVPAALGVSLLFLWMKTWQAIFVRRLKQQFAGRSAPAVTLRGFFRMGLSQTILQPSGLFLLPLSLLTVVPFGWVYAFYQSITALGAVEDEDGAAKRLFKRAAHQARLWPKQNHLLVCVLFVFGLVVFLDVAIGLATAPDLLKMLLGIETAFTRSSWSVFNTTFVAVVGGLTYLCLDPLVKAVYLLRCFYGESLHTGEDLKAELRSFAPGPRAAAPMLSLLIVFASLVPLKAGTPPEAPDAGRRNPAAAVSSADLDRSIEQVLSRREFDWRLPRERQDPAGGKGFFAAFMDGLIDTLRSWARAVGRAVKSVMRWVGEAVDWLREKLSGKRAAAGESDSGGADWMALLRGLIFVLLALAVCAAAILFWRTWRTGGARTEIASEAVAAAPDLADEKLTASQLPEDDWLRLARELIAKGELRLALRALYLASLAHLAQREMIRVARFKSNRDYEQELRRRSRAQPELQAAFAENVGIFDRVWYGLHDVTQEALQRFQINLEKIKGA
jgi:hypothetical protein